MITINYSTLTFFLLKQIMFKWKITFWKQKTFGIRKLAEHDQFFIEKVDKIIKLFFCFHFKNVTSG